jgi:hypothetical protein
MCEQQFGILTNMCINNINTKIYHARLSKKKSIQGASHIRIAIVSTQSMCTALSAIIHFTPHDTKTFIPV